MLRLILTQPLLGTNIFGTDEAPRYTKGMSICAAFTFFIGILAFGLRTLLVWENKKLDTLYGSHIYEGNKSKDQSHNGEGTVGEENYGPHFRYIL